MEEVSKRCPTVYWKNRAAKNTTIRQYNYTLDGIQMCGCKVSILKYKQIPQMLRIHCKYVRFHHCHLLIHAM